MYHSQSIPRWQKILFILILLSSLCSRLKIPYIDFGIHYLLFNSLALTVVMFQWRRIPQLWQQHRNIIILWLSIFCWMWMSAFFSPFLGTAIRYSIKYTSYFLLFFSFLLLTFQLVLPGFYYRCLFYFSLAIVGFGFLEFFHPDLKIFQLLKYPSFHPQIASLLQNPNQFGCLMAIFGISSFIFWNIKLIRNVEFYLSELVFIISLALSGSRNGWLVFILGILFCSFYRVINSKKLALVAGVLVLTLLMVPVSSYKLGFTARQLSMPTTVSTLKSAIPSPSGTALSRFTLWKAAIQQISERPLTGIGIGNFAEQIGVQVFGKKGFHAHNLFLNLSAEQGLIGLGLFLTFLVLLSQTLKMDDALVVIPITLFLLSQIFDVFTEDYTFTTIELFFLAAAINSYLPQHSSSRKVNTLVSQSSRYS